MYRETRIPRLRASLWVSVPDKADSLAEAADLDRGNLAFGPDAAHSPAPSLIVPDWCMDLIVLDGRIVIAGADSTARMFHGSGPPRVGLRFDSGVLPQLLTTSAGELADRVTPLDAVIGGSDTGVPSVGEAASEVGYADAAHLRRDERSLIG